jgi:hypothetical protein
MAAQPVLAFLRKSGRRRQDLPAPRPGRRSPAVKAPPGVAILAAWLALAGQARAADLFVSLQGNDAWSGRLAEPNTTKTDGPLATIEHAQQLVRRLKERGGRTTPIVVGIRGGSYFLAAPIRFGPEDSGTAQAPIVYEGYGQERPVLSGGEKLDGWQVAPDGRWHKTLDEVKRGKWSFAQLFVSDQRRFRPRWPRHGYSKIDRELPPVEKNGRKWHDRFGYAGDDLRSDWTNRGDLEVQVFRGWTAMRFGIESIDPAQHVVVLARVTQMADDPGVFPKGERLLVDNVCEALGEPGSWYLDRPRGELTYVPMPGERPEASVVIAPRLERLLVFQGDPAARRWVEHLRFRGLTLAHSNWTMPPLGQTFGQSEANLDGAVSAVGARSLVIEGCAVRHAGTYAMAFGAGCRDNRVENCELVDLGGGGIKVGHAAGAPLFGWVTENDPEKVPSHHTLRQCLIAHGGRVHAAAAGVWIAHAHDNVVEHNDIFDFYQIGVSAGWTWGYGPSQTHHNDVGFNHIHTIGQNVLSDMAAVYTLGVSPGTRVHDNVCHDVKAHDYGGYGLYTDEGSSGIVMENNLVYRARSGGFHQHYGKENRIQNNIFAFGDEAQLQRTRPEPHTSFFIERNIVYWDNANLVLGNNWWDNHYKLDYNVYWNRGKPIRFFADLNFQQWQQKFGQDRHSIVADPLLVAPEKDDFRLKENSPALKLGFKPFDYSKAGRTAPPVLTRDLPSVPKAFE